MPRFRFKHIANRLLFWILGVCLLIFLGFSALLYQQTSMIIRGQAQSRAELAVDNTVQRIESLLAYVSRSVRTARSSLLTARAGEAQLHRLLRTLVTDKTDVYGMALALEPGVLPDRERFAPYVYRHQQQLRSVDLASQDYDYLHQPWYRNAIDLGQSVWSEPYYDEGGGNIAMVTYSSPIMDTGAGAAATMLGVITADISLQTLNEMVSNIRLGSRGYGYILSASGRIITHQQVDLRMAQVEHTPVWIGGDKDWREVITAARRQQRGHALLPCQAGATEQCWISYEPLRGSNWSILVVIPLADIETGIISLGRIMTALGAGAIGLLALLVLWLSRRLSRPINSLATHTGQIARGDLDSPVPRINSRDEIGSLADNIANMQSELKHHIAELTEASARRQRMESELAIAATIQAQMLPDAGHSQVYHHHCELAARMQAARQIGGDFYLYQLLDEHQLFFFIGDVSDKGIPAALFMAQSITQIRSLLVAHPSPAALLRALNDKLLQNNENCMFVTAIAGLLDTVNGACLMASAGHAAPLLKAGKLTELPLQAGPALGLLEQADYRELALKLEPGQWLLLYTDGVDEAMNDAQQAFGLGSLVQAVSEFADSDCNTLVTRLLMQVLEFQQGQVFDDITLMAIRREPT
jgi:sigma-B regulation protein RsbU (phosphoserine phosphatase)